MTATLTSSEWTLLIIAVCLPVLGLWAYGLARWVGFKTGWWIIMATCCVSLTGCVNDPAAKAAIAGFTEQAKSAAANAEKFRQEIVALRASFQEVQAKLKAGTLDPTEAGKASIEITQMIIGAQQKAEAAARESKEAWTNVKAIKAEYGLSWFQVAGGTVVALVQSYGGWAAVAATAFGAWRLIREKKYKEALVLTVDALESTGSKSPAKLALKKAANPIIQGIVDQKQPEFEARKANGAAVTGMVLDGAGT